MKSEAEQQQELVEQIRGALELQESVSLDSSFGAASTSSSAGRQRPAASPSIASEEPAEIRRFLAKWEALRQAIATFETRLADALELVCSSMFTE